MNDLAFELPVRLEGLLLEHCLRCSSESLIVNGIRFMHSLVADCSVFSVLISDLRFLFMFDVLMRTKRECRKDNILI